MGAMKKNLFLVTALSLMLSLGANATISVEETTEPEYLINNGYSEAAAEEVAIMKNRVAGKPAEPLYQKKQNKFVRGWRYFYGYIDPSVDTDERIHHDIHMSPSWRDL